MEKANFNSDSNPKDLNYNISGQKEENLKESEQKYRHLFEESPIMIVLLDLKGTVIDINPNIFKILGYNKDDLIGKNINELIKNIPEKYSDLVLSKFNKIMNLGYLNLTDIQIYDKERNLKWISAQASLVDLGTFKLIQLILQDITEKKKAEKELKESEEKYRLIIENTNDLIAVLNDKFEHEFINKNAYLKILGYLEEDIIGKRPRDVTHPDDIKQAAKDIKRGLINGDTMGQYRIKHKDGQYIWLETKGHFFNDKGGFLKSIFISRDISERKKVEQKLKESEEKFRTISEQSLMGISIFQDGTVKYVNQRLADLLGYSVKEILSWEPGEFFKTIPPNMKKKILHLTEMLNKDPSKLIYSYQSQGIKKNGERIWLEVYLKSILFLGKKAYLATFIDINEQKNAKKELMDSEEKYRHLFESSPYAIILTDSTGNIIDCNNSCKQLFSFLIKDNHYNRNFYDIFSESLNSEKALSIFRKKYHNILKGDISDPFNIEFITLDGKNCWLNFQTSLIRIEGNILIQMIVQDITDKKEAERLIIEENQKLLELSQMKNELVSRVSHELKTPLNSIYGAAQVLLNLFRDQVSSKAYEFIKMINRGGEKLKLLIENLLDISRLESGKLDLDIRKENLVKIVKENVENIRYMANQRNLIVNLELPIESYLEIDKIRIEQVLMNILSNAIKNTPPGGTISILLYDCNKWIDISIKDTGVGFTEKEKNENLFKKFGKIERYGKNLDVDIEGSGLGLYISKEIIDLHGGKIWVESEGRNKGSTFNIRLFKN